MKKESAASLTAVPTVTDYLNGFHYVDDQLIFLQHVEGRITKNGTSFDYEYNLTDHFGNGGRLV